MKTRNQALEIASLREFDLVVIGGGIAGAGVAQDAASRGLSVLLVEKDDFASGTSSRTTKLIHGGLRYLEQFNFALTWELCRERALLEQLAPHMVRDFSFILPLKKEHRFLALKAKVGLALYDVLSWAAAGSSHHTEIRQREVFESAPALQGSDVVSGLRFHDCVTDDSRLVIEVIKSACNAGAIAINYLEVIGFDLGEGKIQAVRCHDRYSGSDVTIRCRTCVNATGVWCDQLMRMIEPGWSIRVLPAKGIHIMVPSSAFETNTALFLPTFDKRYVFVVPWQRALMIGTTDSLYQGKLENPLPNSDEIDYLLSAVNGYCRERKLNRSDIIASWAGLRPLVKSNLNIGLDSHKSATEVISRRYSIIDGPGGIVSLIGGKLTNYRIMARDVVNTTLTKLPDDPARKLMTSRTERMMLGGFPNKQVFLTATAAIAAKARKLSIEPATLDHLISSYGMDAQVIVDIVEHNAALSERICPDFPNIMAEVTFCIRNEMAVSLEDVLLRRTRLGILHQIQCQRAAPKVAALMQRLLSWDDARTALEISALERSLEDHLQVLYAGTTISK